MILQNIVLVLLSCTFMAIVSIIYYLKVVSLISNNLEILLIVKSELAKCEDIKSMKDINNMLMMSLNECSFSKLEKSTLKVAIDICYKRRLRKLK